MKNFYYRAKNSDNEIKDGYILALSLTDAANKLEAKKLDVLELSLEEKQHNNYKNLNIKNPNEIVFSVKEKKEFFNAFYFQYKSGLSITDNLKSIINSSNRENIKSFCSIILRKIEKGSSLKESFGKYPNTLGKAYTMLLCAGEESGKLEDILLNILNNIKKEEELKSSITSSMLYPISILLLAIAVFLFFKFFIFKIFETMADGLSNTQIISLLITAIIKIIVIFILIGVTTFYVYKNNSIKQKIFSLFSKIKVISKLLENYYFHSFFTVLSLADESGVPITESLQIANSVIKVRNVNNKLNKAEQMISKGCEITTAFGVANVFSDYAMSQISAGEKAGELDKVFKAVANDYEKKLETSIKVLSKLLEPAMIIIVGIIVMFIAVSAYTKYYEGIFSMI